LNARIGYPNEHLASNHIAELEKPMYSTCIGLILKGYSVYENNQNRLFPEQRRTQLKPPVQVEEQSAPEMVIKAIPIKERKTLKGFMDSIKGGLIDLFKEDGDSAL